MRQPLRLADVRIALPGRVLIDALSFDVEPGRIVTVMGPSGSGKSALLSWIGGFLGAPFEARGERLARRASPRSACRPMRAGSASCSRTTCCFRICRSPATCCSACRARSPGGASARPRSSARSTRPGLAGFGARDPATLSGGQRARVALLRTLLAQPQALLLDEPFGKLDAALRADFRRFVFDFARRAGLPTVLVTHDAADAEATGGPVIELT